jgi:indole-3-glycerol phosphate synthase
MGTDFLKTIVDAKKEEIAAAKKRISESDLCRMASVGRSKRPFFEKLAQPGKSGINIIAEIKRASPSKGPIRLDLNPAAYAAEYEAGGACAISVLTDEKFFRGSLEDLKAARAASTLPVLRKDFIISPYQIYESVLAGADAVLLIARILDKTRLRALLDLCGQLDVDALVEIHSKDDAVSAAFAGARLIGINNRDLSSFKTDVHTAGRLASLLGPDQVAVAASAIQCREDIDQNLQAGIFNFLIGESLVRADDPKLFLRSLFEPKVIK